MDTFGDRLRRKREELGLALDDVSKATRVGVHHLAALERGDLDALPNEVFVKGFVRGYAGCLRIDADALVAEYVDLARARRPEAPASGEEPLVREMSRLLAHRDPGARSAWGRGALLAAGALALLLVAWLWLRPGGDTAAGRAGSKSAAPPVRSAAPARATAVPEPPAAPLEGSIGRTRASAVIVAQSPEPEAADPVVTRPPADPSNLAVSEFGVGTGVRNGGLVGEASRFEAGTSVYFWTRVTGASPGDTIRHVWYREGRAVSRIPLQLGGSRWRTQSRKNLSQAGRWSVEAQDAEGNVLARSEFDCVTPG